MLYGQRAPNPGIRVSLRVSDLDFISTALLRLAGDDTGAIDAQPPEAAVIFDRSDGLRRYVRRPTVHFSDLLNLSATLSHWAHLLWKLCIAFRKTRQFIYVRLSFYGATSQKKIYICSLYAPMLCRSLVVSRKRRSTAQVRIRLLGVRHALGVVDRKLTCNDTYIVARLENCRSAISGAIATLFIGVSTLSRKIGGYGAKTSASCRLGMDSPVI